MRLLYVITDLNIGGAEHQVTRLGITLRRRGWEVQIVSMLPPQAFTIELAKAGIEIAHLGMRPGIPDPRAILRLSRLIRQWRPDLVHSHMVHANLLSRVTRLVTPMPILICTARSTNEGGRWRALAYRLTDGLCELTTHLSRSGADRAVRIGAVPARKVRVVPNGIDTHRFRPDATARARLRAELALGEYFVWLAAGRFAPPKDYPTMLRAFALARKRKESLLLIAGQGPLQEACRRLTKELGVEDSVRFLGVRNDMADLMNAADAFVMSSLWEGMPTAMLEAAACGLPIVATNVGGIPEILPPDAQRYLTSPKDPQALSTLMIELMRLPLQQRQHLGQCNRHYVEAHYDLEEIANRWEDIYKEFLNRRHPL